MRKQRNVSQMKEQEKKAMNYEIGLRTVKISFT